MQTSPILSVLNIEKSYDCTKALDNISFDVYPGQILSIVARNGAGKSTLVSVISGLLAADKGNIAINGECRQGRSLSRDNQSLIGVAGQETGVYPELTIEENLRFFAELYGLSRREQNQRIKEVTGLLGLSNLLKRKGNQLSGGERRRLHTGAALMHKPKLLLLDEPTVGADPHARNDILETVKILANEGTAIIYTSHYFPEIEALNADIAVMDKGRLLELDSQDNLLQRYRENIIQVEFDQAIADHAADRLTAHYDEVRAQQPNHLQIDIGQQAFALSHLIEQLGEVASNITQINHEQTSLERVFIQLTQAQ